MIDVLIRNGRVVDGTGSPWYWADIAIEKGRVAAIGGLGQVQASRVLDARGLVVAPGFIDIHSHSDVTLLVDGRAESKVRQGITTEVNGNCGVSAAPLKGMAAERMKRDLSSYGLELDWTTFEGYYGRLTRQGISINAASYVGHGTVRQAVMGNAQRAPTQKEMEEMKAHVERAMSEGAIGLSTGLEFAPGGYAETGEIVELCRVISQFGGIYATHQRNRDTHYEASTREAVEIGERAGVRVQLSHFVPRYPGHDKAPTLLWMVDQARRRGVDVTFDVIPPTDAPLALRRKLRDGYHWAEQSLAHQLIPPWGFEGGPDEVMRRLRDPETRQRFRSEHVPQWKLFGCPKGKFRILGTEYDFPDVVPPMWDRILLNSSRASPDLVGKTLEEIARAKGVTDPWDAAMDVVTAEIEKTRNPNPDIGILGASTAERDSIMALKHPAASVCTDRNALVPYGALAGERSPNSYGAFARVFRKYVRELGIFTLE
ncbi:MAG: amidohydrolase family protein, partial [Chloroflexota bacterium]|nr:amidohydrolase family protein [Chloroflexota bacterium]